MKVATWDMHEGTTYGYAEDGTELVAIEPLQDEAKRAKWGEKYTPGRAWYAYAEDGDEITRGHAKDLRAAKKEATAALAEHAQKSATAALAEFHSEPQPGKYPDAIMQQVTEVRAAYAAQKTGMIGPWLYGYTTRGGTYMLASPAKWNDSGKPRDLIAILPRGAQMLGLPSRVLVLTPTVNRDLAEALAETLDA